MAWIKRNLPFLVGAVVALALMGAAGWFLFQRMGTYDKAKEELNQGYEDLKRLTEQKPHPGDGKVDNTKLAREMQVQVRAWLAKARNSFRHVPGIPDAPTVTDQVFAGDLRKTIDQLQKDATNASVILPPQYKFSFQDIATRIAFDHETLAPLAAELGEVKAISDILIGAKVNYLDGIRRERVCKYDTESQTDYLDAASKSITNQLAILRPYEVTFRCFSAELAAVLSGFASSPDGFIVKGVNIESAGTIAAPTDVPPPVYAVAPVYTAPTPQRSAEEFRSRYGLGKGGPGGPPPPPVAAAQPATVVAAPVRSGPQVVINERLLKVTMSVVLVKLDPSVGLAAK